MKASRRESLTLRPGFSRIHADQKIQDNQNAFLPQSNFFHDLVFEVSERYGSRRRLGQAESGVPQEDTMTSKLRIDALTLAVLTGTVGYAAAQDYRYDNRGYERGYDRGYDRDDYRYDNFRRGFHTAREFGFRDG